MEKGRRKNGIVSFQCHCQWHISIRQSLVKHCCVFTFDTFGCHFTFSLHFFLLCCIYTLASCLLSALLFRSLWIVLFSRRQYIHVVTVMLALIGVRLKMIGELRVAEMLLYKQQVSLVFDAFDFFAYFYPVHCLISLFIIRSVCIIDYRHTHTQLTHSYSFNFFQRFALKYIKQI